MSSSSNASDSDSDQPDDLTTSGLVATRAKRRTAGNLYATLRANLDDEELQKELLAEDEAEDAEDYAVSDREDDDAAMESDESDEDAANAEGDENEGERELKRAERAEGRKQKKAMDARMRVPGLVPKKRVRVIEEGEGEGDAEEAERRKKKKKSERSSWLPEGVDAPTRQSRRELAVKNREVIHANLKESAQRSEKQKKLMKDAAKRVRMTDRLPLTQEQRFEKCKRIEKETAKELGRTEREEAERIRLREEALAAKRKRDIEGPVMRTWSGSGVFEDGKLKVKRLGSKTMKEYEVEAKKREEEAREEARRKEEEARKEAEKREEEAREEARRQAEEAKRREEERLEEERKERERIEAARIEAEQAEAAKKENEKAAMDLIDWGGESSRPGTADERMEDAPTLGEPSETVDQTAATEDPLIEPPGEKHADEPVEPSNTWLSGIHEYAAQTEDKPGLDHVPYTPSAPAINAANIHSEASGLSRETPAQQDFAGAPSVQQHTSIQPSQLSTPSGPSTPTVAHSAQMQPSQPGFLPGTMTFSATPQPPVSTATPQPPPPPPAPVLREQAQRTLLVLDSFPSLTYPQPPTKPRKSLLSSQSGPLDETPLSRTLIPNSHPSFTSEESRYLSRVLKRNKLDALPEPPQKPKCAVTGWAAKYTDPKTGLPYADLQTYKIVQRMVAGGSAWSGFLGAWVGPQTAVSLRMGRPARGVPEGFAPAGETVVKKEAEAEAAK